PGGTEGPVQLVERDRQAVRVARGPVATAYAADGGDLRGHLESPVSCRPTVNSATSTPPRRRARLLAAVTIAIRNSQVTNKASNEAAVETGPLLCSKFTIHTGNVW